MKNNNNLKEFKQKFIGYIDILGWKQRIEEAEKGIGMPLSELHQILDEVSCKWQAEMHLARKIEMLPGWKTKIHFLMKIAG